MYDPGFSDTMRDLVIRARTDDTALEKLQTALLAQNELVARAQLATTQAVDWIGGGVKSNAIPTSARATINHRIAGWRWDISSLL